LVNSEEMLGGEEGVVQCVMRLRAVVYAFSRPWRRVDGLEVTKK
jgi:endonuclease V-like protein UPF0215 family